eukprot:TRINITY_DN1026_c0_g1_i1.p1 TRINITY_DN1026_c0_g1~~TRINITY_DN1026_c0_g1_i1.p1  ORF type:complete len:326 (+),score=68.22 TRINITY_DN1026_c0_g1_i1:3-980(+)
MCIRDSNRCLDENLMELLEHDDPENWFRSYLSKDISHNYKACVLSEALSIQPVPEFNIPLGLEHEVVSMAFINEYLVAISFADYSVRIWDCNEKTLGQNCEGHQAPVISLATIRVFQPDKVDEEEDLDLATGDQSGLIIMWSLSQSAENRVCQHHQDAIVSIVDMRDGNTVASGARDGKVVLWDIQDAELIEEQQMTAPLTDLILSKNKDFLIVADQSPAISILEVLYSKKLETNLVDSLRVQRVIKMTSICTCLNTDFTVGKFIFSGHADGTVKVWDLVKETQAPVQQLTNFDGEVADMILVEDAGNLNAEFVDKYLLLSLIHI